MPRAEANDCSSAGPEPSGGLAGLCGELLPRVPSAQWARAQANGKIAFVYLSSNSKTQSLHLTSLCRKGSKYQFDARERLKGTQMTAYLPPQQASGE